MMIPSHFTKMSGAGNDFLVFEADGEYLEEPERQRLRKLCSRRLSAGADGALFVRKAPGGQIRVDYFNADGGRASFCANGTRCAARFAHRRGMLEGSEGTLLTGWGEIRAAVDEARGEVTLHLPDVPNPKSSIPISIAGLPPRAVPLEVGVPHLIVVTRELDGLNLEKVGPPLRHDSSLPEGANVHFVKALGPHRLKIRSYERGVEGETLACGSGVVAAAVVTAAQQLVSPPVECETQSGAVLIVDFERTDAAARRVRLTGEARFVYEGEIGPDTERF
jgi:diaminopimelate epimerase